MKKLLLVSFAASVGCSLFADIEAGTYENMNVSDTKFSSPEAAQLGSLTILFLKIRFLWNGRLTAQIPNIL